MQRNLKDGERTAVAVVGAGPVGLTASLVLARAGIDVVLLEAETRLVEDLRTTIIQPCSLEIWSLLYATQGFIEYGTKCRTMQFRERTDGVVANLRYDCLDKDTSYPHILLCALPYVVPNLFDQVRASGKVLVGFGHRVETIRLGQDNVELSVEGPSGPLRIKANFVIAADGTRSAIRDALSINRLRIAPGNRLYRLTLDNPLDLYLPKLEHYSYVMDPVCYGLILRNPGFWRFPIGHVAENPQSGEQISDDTDGRDLIRRFMFPNHELKITAMRPIPVTNWIASDFGMERVLFAGDSAHAMNPMAGLGMNSGILEAVEAGLAVGEAAKLGCPGERWVAYVADRPRVARDTAVRALNRYHLLTESNRQRRDQRNRWLQALETDDVRRRSCLMDFSLLDRFRELRDDLMSLVESGDIRPAKVARDLTYQTHCPTNHWLS